MRTPTISIMEIPIGRTCIWRVEVRLFTRQKTIQTKYAETCGLRPSVYVQVGEDLCSTHS